jgi:amino acid transporter
VAILIHAAVALALALGGSFAQLALLSAVARLATYLFTCISVPIVRKRTGNLQPQHLIVPILGVLFSLTLVYVLNQARLIAGAIALATGAIIYLVSRPTPGGTSSGTPATDLPHPPGARP